MKYFLFGGMSAAFTRCGLSLIYGLSGSTNLQQIAANLNSGQTRLDPLLLAAIVMTVIGFGFQDPPVAAVSSLGAGRVSRRADPEFGVDCFRFKGGRVFYSCPGDDGGVWRCGRQRRWHHYAAGWLPVLAILAALSMLLGNLAAINQSSVKRLLAYSAIAHAELIRCSGFWRIAGRGWVRSFIM